MRPNLPQLTTPQAHQRGVDIALLLLTFGAIAAGLVAELALDAQGEGIAIGMASALTFLLILLLIPRRYEVHGDRLAIAFLWRRWQIPFESIETLRPAPLWSAYGYLGMRFATAPSQSVEIRRVKAHLLTRPNLVVSPAGHEDFLRVLQQARDEFQANRR